MPLSLYKVVNYVDLLTNADYCIPLCTGSLPPNVPTLLNSIAGQTQATISWIVTSIAYTLETYSVEYGIRVDDLGMTKNLLGGSNDSAAINQAYSLTITDLEPFTQYYYAVTAHNSFTSTESSIQTFRTAEAGMHASLVQSYTISDYSQLKL